MKRWDKELGKDVESKKIDAFLAEIKLVCKKHGLSISHEDGYGAFEIEAYSDDNLNWLYAATKCVNFRKKKM